MRPVQYFSDEYLERCRKASPEQVLRFLEAFRQLLQASPDADGFQKLDAKARVSG